MSSQNNMSDVRKMTMPTGFLTLGPVTSSGYAQVAKPEDSPQFTRRSSSMASDKPPTYRILKLGPVHLGEHQGENKDDWVAVE